MKIKKFKYFAYTMVVVDGQPYYESTGVNSGSKGTWLPFIMLAGNKKRNWLELPKTYNTLALLKLSFVFAFNPMPNYIIKYELENLEIDNIPEQEKFAQEYTKMTAELLQRGRFPTISTLITSARLGQLI